MTGAFTGLVDAPAQVYRHNRDNFDQRPIYWPFNIVFMAPLGFLAGPLVGFGKGIALDVECLQGKARLGRVFGRYDNESVWRPFTLDW